MHINRNVLAEYEKIKKLKKTAEKNQVLSEFMWKVYKPPSTKAERSQEVTLSPRKRKLKSDLAEKKQQLGKTKKMLLEKSTDLENMKNQLVARQASVELLEKEKEKEHSENQNLSFEIAKLKSEASDTVKLQKDLNDYQQKCATQEGKLKETKSKLKYCSKSYNKMLEKLDRKQ